MVNPVLLYNKILAMPPEIAEEVNDFIDFVIGRKINVQEKICSENTTEKNNILPEGGFGCLKGKIWMSEDFDEPIDDFNDYM